MKTIYLVDVSSMFFRAFYAVRPLTNPAGMPTNAIFGFLQMTVKLLKDIKPDYMAFCFDRKEPSFRRDMDQRYKANRSEMPEELVPQVPYIRRVSEALGIPCFDRLSYEADDVIGSFARYAGEQGWKVVIVSGDKDFGQLVNPNVIMYDTMKEIRYDEIGVKEKWGIPPEQVIDYLAITGDSSDNIPGVAGLGPKGAQKLLLEFGSLENVYANLDKISSASVRKKLEDSREDAFLSKKLVTIVQDLELVTSETDLQMRPIKRDELLSLLQELDFKSFIKSLLGSEASSASSVVGSQSEPTSATAAKTSAKASVKKDLSAEFSSQTMQFVRTPIESKSGAKGVMFTPASIPASAPEALGAVGTHASTTDIFRTEQKSAPTLFSVVPLEFKEHEDWTATQVAAWLGSKEEIIALHTERGSYLAAENDLTLVRMPGSDESEIQILRAALEREALKLSGFDLKSFGRFWRLQKINVAWDDHLAAYTLKAGSVGELQEVVAEHSHLKISDLPSAAELVSAHIQLRAKLESELRETGMLQVYQDMELPLVSVLLEMESNGICLDTNLLADQSAVLKTDIQQLEKSIHELAGDTFNIGSPKQMGVILFEKLKLPASKKTKTGYSTDSDVLEGLKDQHAIVPLILNYRELTKLKSTYVDSLPLLVDKLTGRLHTTFNQALTSTGRLSSQNPNLQNIPIRTPRGAAVRKAFVAPEGRVLLSADYSQIELRILAHIADDQGLIRAFELDQDIHTATAAEVFEVPLEQVSSEMRRKAKAVNFGLAYGQGAYGLAETLGVPRKEATEIIQRYFTRFSGVKEYMSAIVEKAHQDGYVETIFGHRRYLRELKSPSAMVRKFGERAAINAPIQGTASDLVKIAMLEVEKQILDLSQNREIKMLLQVHDELVFECPVQLVDPRAAQIKTVMESVAKLKVPLKVNIGSGLNWDEAH